MVATGGQLLDLGLGFSLFSSDLSLAVFVLASWSWSLTRSLGRNLLALVFAF